MDGYICLDFPSWKLIDPKYPNLAGKQESRQMDRQIVRQIEDKNVQNVVIM